MSVELAVVPEQLNGLQRPIHGSLCVFGDWFGKPYDNDHVARRVLADADRLVVQFDDDEVLTIWAPSGVNVSSDAFRIDSADRVRFEWYYYGSPKLPENRFVEEHAVAGSHLEATTTADRYSPQFEASLEHPAVELRNVPR
jgi:hypothetical protein